jgi:hypothetical protein
MEKRVIIQKPTTNIDRALIQNFVSLQRVLTDLAIKLDGLSNNMGKLLELFEMSAKTVAEEPDSNKEISKKLDTLLEQNKTIAKGLSLVSEREFSRFRR